MEEMRVYIANLGKYNEGELVGAWFEPPIDMDEVRERIGLNDQYEEYAIHDYELPFEIGEYTPIEEINRLCEMVEDLPDYIRDNMGSLLSYYSGVEDFCEHADDIILWSGCDTTADVAEQMLDEGQTKRCVGILTVCSTGVISRWRATLWKPKTAYLNW